MLKRCPRCGLKTVLGAEHDLECRARQVPGSQPYAPGLRILPSQKVEGVPDNQELKPTLDTKQTEEWFQEEHERRHGRRIGEGDQNDQ